MPWSRRARSPGSQGETATERVQGSGIEDGNNGNGCPRRRFGFVTGTATATAEGGECHGQAGWAPPTPAAGRKAGADGKSRSPSAPRTTRRFLHDVRMPGVPPGGGPGTAPSGGVARPVEPLRPARRVTNPSSSGHRLRASQEALRQVRLLPLSVPTCLSVARASGCSSCTCEMRGVRGRAGQDAPACLRRMRDSAGRWISDAALAVAGAVGETVRLSCGMPT